MLIGTRQKPAVIGAIATAVLLLLSFVSWQGYALTESGTLVLNQAAATYTDSNGVSQDVTSNQVETVIRQVAGLELVSSQSKPGIRNGQVLFPHVLANTGNGPDTYELCIANEVGSFSFDAISIYADEDEDGLPDLSTQITDEDFDGCFDVGPVSAGGTFPFVIVVETPDIPATNQNAQFDVSATSDFDLSLTQSNTDDVTLIDGPLIEVVKSLTQYSGYAGTGGYSVTLEYRNVGSEAATGLLITDVLPTIAADGSTGDASLGMIYTNGTASWQQGTAANLASSAIALLTDADDADVQTDGGVGVVYCAYALDSSCSLAPFGNNQMTIQIDTVPVGGIGSVTFDFSIDSGYDDNAVFNNFVTFEYRDALDTLTFGEYESNTVSFVVTDEVEAPAVVANNSNTLITEGVLDSNDSGNVVEVLLAGQTEAILFSNYIWNAAPAGVDTFDITIDSVNDREGNPIGAGAFPAGTSFTLLKEDGQTPLLDTDGNGIPDTGPLDSGDFAEVVLRVVMPAETFGDNATLGWSVTKIATSVADANVTNAVTDKLTEIAVSTVDLTNDAAGAEGAGIGPEVEAVNTLTIAPGTTDFFQLWVENSSNEADSYSLSFSDQNFVEDSLPVGWSVTFFTDGGAGDCSTTGVVATGAFVALPGFAERQLFCASVTIDEGAAPVVEQDLYFKVSSASTGAQDIKLDAVTIPAMPLLEIEFDLEGQIEPGGTATFPHTLFNRGNQDLECVNVSLSNSLVADGWTSSSFLDIDEDGQLSAGDVALTDQILAVGGQFRILVRLFAPATAPFGIENLTFVTAEGEAADGSGCGVGLVLTDQVVDRSNTTNTDMVITKKQLLDSDCNGVADIGATNTAALFSLDEFTVLPGECVIYRLDATNQGVAILYNAVVRDIVPGFTSYLASAEQCVVQNADPCTFISPPSNGAISGAITVESAQVLPGGEVTVFFGIQVE